MSRLTKLVLIRPVTTLLVVLSLIFFGGMSIISQKMELTPEISMPMLVVTTTYPGASPEVVNDNITKKIEEGCGTLSGLDSMTSRSSENYSLTLLQYEYGTDMDNAYSELRKRMDSARSSLPEDAGDPTIIEMDINAVAVIYLCVENSTVNNIYNYVRTSIVPEFEKLSSVASVETSGGSQEYISVRLIPEKLRQYHLDISTVAQLVGTASVSMPGGTTAVGSTDMNVALGVDYKTVEALRRLPITVGGGNIIYLEDIADVGRTEQDSTGIGRYNGNDTVMLGIQRNQKYTAVDVSNQVMRTLKELEAEDPNFHYVIINDSADLIRNSVSTMFKTMALAVAISMAVLFIFYGDLKGSLIVATSIPISLLTALVMMWAMGYSLNIITLGSVVLAVGMMVDNSIVVLESCFRAMEKRQGGSFAGYAAAAVEGSGTVAASILGSTLTTCVVFLPLAFLKGLTGQLFQPLAMTIVFCMIASLLSAVTIVPLCYVFYKPVEKEKAPAYHLIRSMQNGYRRMMERIMKHRKKTILITLALFVGSLMLAGTLDSTMMPEVDEGTLTISVSMKPNLNVDAQNEVVSRIEEIIMADGDMESCMVMSGGGMMGGGSATVLAYLKSDRVKSTKETMEVWKDQLQAVDNCDISISASSTTSMMNAGSNFSMTLLNSDYDRLKEASDKITDALMLDRRVTAVNSSLANSSPLIKVDVDPVLASAEGLNPAQVFGMLYNMLNGSKADTMEVDGEELSVWVEYPKEEFENLQQVQNILISTPSGGAVLLKDIAEIRFEDSPATITRVDKQYQAVITAEYTDLSDRGTMTDLRENVVKPLFTKGTTEKENSSDEMMNEEFGNLFKAIAIAVFLVFVVMAAQFESVRFSIMVMTTIPMALIGSFFFLWLFDVPISMLSLMGFLMMTGTVVNNGILFVDTADQHRRSMELEPALIEAGAIRLRPILMTTLTTVLAMIPMAAGIGEAGAIMQGLALVNAGGLAASTVMALLVLPVYYMLMNGKRKERGRSLTDGEETK